METPVKERLVGAIILVLLLSLLVPELLSGPQHSKPADAPDGQTAPLRTYTIDLNGAAKPAAAPRPAPAAPVTSRPVSSFSPPPASMSKVEPDSPSLPSASAGSQHEAPKSKSAKPEPTKSVSASTLPSPTTTAAPKVAAAAASVSSTPSSSSTPASIPTSGSGWTVQLGSFSKSENAERLVKELKAKHYKAFVSRTGTGAKTRYRVRVGPEEDRAQAQKLAERLKDEGRQVSIIPQP